MRLRMFRYLACGSRCDTTNWSIFNAVFVRNQDCFKIVHLEEINGIPYLFSHAGLTLNWINKVNSSIWKLADNKITLANSDIIERINELDDNDEGQELLSIIGRFRNVIGPKSGSVLWADIEEHAISSHLDIRLASMNHFPTVRHSLFPLNIIP